MIDHFHVHFKNGLGYLQKHPQLLFTLGLIFLIPIAFIVSGQQFLNAARDNQEMLERERIGLLHDAFVSIIRISDFQPEIIQHEIEILSAQNDDIISFNVVKESNSSQLIVASLDKTEIGSVPYVMEEYRLSAINDQTSYILPKAQNGIRYWSGYRIIRTSNNDIFYIYTKTSLETIDTLLANRVMHAYYWLIGLLCIVLVLLVRHVRLIDYAYLYTETKKTNEMKDLFTNMIAHELRAPLTAMRGYASLIEEKGDIPDETRLNAHKINDATQRLLLVINDLLDVARIQSGKLSLSYNEIDLQKIIDSVLDAISVNAQEKHIVLTREGMRQPLFVSVDEKRIFQVLTNLVSNAIKYTKAGTITVSIEDKGTRVELRVKDTGMGISAENQKQLFSPFFRVENMEVNQSVGTGLGMWITKQFIELMKGSVAVESIKGVGTHIVVTLPK